MTALLSTAKSKPWPPTSRPAAIASSSHSASVMHVSGFGMGVGDGVHEQPPQSQPYVFSIVSHV